MSDYGIAFVIFALAVVTSIPLFIWANRALRRSGRKEYGFIKHGGAQASLGLLLLIVALIAMIIGFVHLL